MKGANHMAYRIMKIMASLLLISIIISLVNIYDFNEKFNSKKTAISYINDYNKHYIAIVPEDKGATIDLLIDGISTADQEFNIITEIYRTNNKAEQLEIMEMAGLAKVDGIILWPSANSGFVEPINELYQQKIPVVLISVDSTNSQRKSFIGLGRSSVQMAVTELANAIEGTGTICMLSYPINYTDSDIRMEEFTQIANKYKTISTKSYYIKDQGILYEVEQIKEIVKNNPYIDAFFCLDSKITLAATSALQHLKNEQVLVMGYNNFEKSEDYILNDNLYGIIFENTEFMGYVAVKYLRDINRNKWVPELLDPGIKLMTKETLDTFSHK